MQRDAAKKERMGLEDVASDVDVWHSAWCLVDDEVTAAAPGDDVTACTAAAPGDAACNVHNASFNKASFNNASACTTVASPVRPVRACPSYELFHLRTGEILDRHLGPAKLRVAAEEPHRVLAEEAVPSIHWRVRRREARMAAPVFRLVHTQSDCAALKRALVLARLGPPTGFVTLTLQHRLPPVDERAAAGRCAEVPVHAPGRYAQLFVILYRDAGEVCLEAWSMHHPLHPPSTASTEQGAVVSCSRCAGFMRAEARLLRLEPTLHVEWWTEPTVRAAPFLGNEIVRKAAQADFEKGWGTGDDAEWPICSLCEDSGDDGSEDGAHHDIDGIDSDDDSPRRDSTAPLCWSTTRQRVRQREGQGARPKLRQRHPAEEAATQRLLMADLLRRGGFSTATPPSAGPPAAEAAEATLTVCEGGGRVTRSQSQSRSLAHGWLGRVRAMAQTRQQKEEKTEEGQRAGTERESGGGGAKHRQRGKTSNIRVRKFAGQIAGGAARVLRAVSSTVSVSSSLSSCRPAASRRTDHPITAA